MKRIVAIVVPLVALGALVGWRLTQKQQELVAQEQQAKQRKGSAPQVEVATVAQRDIVHYFEGIGQVEPILTAKLMTKVAGKVNDLTVREGDLVAAQQQLIRISTPELDAQITGQEAVLAEAKARLAQAKLNTNPTDVGIRAQIQQQVAAVGSASANVTQAQTSLAAQVGAAEAGVTDQQARVDAAQVAITNAQTQLRNAQTSLVNAKARLDRVAGLFEKGFASAQDLDNARTAHDVQKGLVDVAQGQVEAAQQAKGSAQAQLQVAQRQVELARSKGKAELAVAQASQRQAQAALDLARANTAQKPAFRANLDALQAAVAVAQGQLANLKALKATTFLKTPIAGVVTQRLIDPGTLATTGQPLLVVEAVQEVYVALAVPEELAQSIVVGKEADVQFDALPGKRFPGQITHVGGATDPDTHQFTVRIALNNPLRQLKSGMFARVKIETERVAAAIVVPREAVKKSKEGTTITVVTPDDTVQVRPIQQGAQDNEGIAITDGVQLGEKVVVLSMMPLKDGQKVRTGGAPKKGEGPKK